MARKKRKSKDEIELLENVPRAFAELGEGALYEKGKQQYAAAAKMVLRIGLSVSYIEKWGALSKDESNMVFDLAHDWITRVLAS